MEAGRLANDLLKSKLRQE